jgi:phasin
MDTDPKTKSASFSKSDTQQQLSDMAEKGAKQSKEAFEKMSAATGEATDAMKDCCSTAIKGAQEYNNKLIEFTQVNTNAAFEYIQKLFGVKSPSEFVDISSEQARRQFETLAEQTKQLAMLTQHVTLASAEPLKTGFTKASNRAA